MLRLFAIAGLSGLLISFTHAQAQSPTVCLRPLAVKEATEESWAPGVVRENTTAAGGSLYRISVIVRKKGNVLFDKLILNDQVLTIEAVHEGQRHADGPFSKGDEVLLIARSDRARPGSTPEDAVVSMIKKRNAAGALLYTFRDKQYLRPIEAFTEKRSNPLPK